MEEEVKLVVAHSLDGEEQQFYIFENVKLGEGGFGIVKKAAAASDKAHQLAVKIVPYGGDLVKKNKIQRQINILRILPQHPNLVKVLPIKCFSQNNFYIFMELCKEGTLSDIVRQPGLLQEKQIFNIFWQLMSGYRVLWQKKIVHQDLKLANVLIKNGVFKITDFGFSILQQRYVSSLTREGTLQYMPYEKLTDPLYQADQKTDVYALGIMMYEVITKMHPYINQKKISTQKQFVTILRGAQLTRPRIVNNFSAPLQGLLDLVTQMVNKTAKNRIGCSEIFAYIDNQQIFTQYRQRQYEKTQEFHLNPAAMTIIGKTSIYMVPFPIEPQEEQEYLQKLHNQKELKKNEENKKMIENIEQWLLIRRLYIYFFDRLCRRLFVEKIKGNFSNEKIHIYNKVILGCLLLQCKMAKYILKQLKFPKIFGQLQMNIFKASSQGVRSLKIIRRDEEYIRQQLTDNLKRTNQFFIKEQKKLIQLSQKDEFESFNKMLIEYILQCITQKADFVSNRSDLVTLYYLIDAILFIDSLPEIKQNLQFQEYFFQTQTKNKLELLNAVEKYLGNHEILSNYDEQIYEEEASLLVQKSQ